MPLQTAAPAEFPSSVLTLESEHDFQTTIGRFKENLKLRGVTLFAEIDQAAAAAQVGMQLRPTTVLLFGNPLAGTPVMDANPYSALALPLKAVIWEDEREGVHIAYEDVAKTLGPQYGIASSLYTPLAGMPALLRLIAGLD
jgi:uncharacterized protein (DUF302 family)